nr:MAG TPA: hypothetical protein [Crassvirales sp.]DAX04742.1 MAG TPA: hypothetical protein [Bacteriophage sp.]
MNILLSLKSFSKALKFIAILPFTFVGSVS